MDTLLTQLYLDTVLVLMWHTYHAIADIEKAQRCQHEPPPMIDFVLDWLVVTGGFRRAILVVG